MMPLDQQFLDIGLALLLNLLTQVAKRFHTNPFTVFKTLALIISVLYGVVAFFGYQDHLMSVIASITTIVGLASGFWHIFMRPEGPVMQWWNKRK